MDRMNKEELTKLIESLGIDTEEFMVLSSGSLPEYKISSEEFNK